MTLRYRPAPPPIEDLRLRLVEAALPHVPFDGWTHAAFLAGAREIGVPPVDVERAFPEGPAEAAELFAHMADMAMAEAMAGLDTGGMKVRERIAAAVRLRLERLAPDREAVRKAVGLLALPVHAGRAARTMARTVDEIWHAAGDRSADFGWYTKRGLLAAVYGATLLHWLDDRSEGSARTWAFLDRRIADVMRIPKLQARVSAQLSRLGRLAPRVPFARGLAGRNLRAKP